MFTIWENNGTVTIKDNRISRRQYVRRLNKETHYERASYDDAPPPKNAHELTRTEHGLLVIRREVPGKADLNIWPESANIKTWIIQATVIPEYYGFVIYSNVITGIDGRNGYCHTDYRLRKRLITEKNDPLKMNFGRIIKEMNYLYSHAWKDLNKTLDGWTPII